MPTLPLIFGHRGACALAPENTLSSFLLAFEQGADAIELDTKLSRDGEIIVIHDQSVDRTTNGKGTVGELTLVELKTLDAGVKFGSRFIGEQIPTLEEVFKELGGKLLINVELTNYKSPSDELVSKVAALVRSMNLVDSVMFSSFLPGNLAKMSRSLPGSKVGILALKGLAGYLSRSFIGRKVSPEFVHPFYSDVTPEFIIREHKKGRKINVWTVNNLDIARNLCDWGVDGIMTDDPGALRKHLEGR